MPESRIRTAIENLFKEAGENITEDRAVDYIVRELQGGRKLNDILDDDYIKNRIHGDHIAHVLQNKALTQEFDRILKETFPK